MLMLRNVFNGTILNAYEHGPQDKAQVASSSPVGCATFKLNCKPLLLAHIPLFFKCS